MSVLLLLASVIGLAALLLAAVVSFASGTRRRAARLAAVAILGLVVYGSALVVTSLASGERVLAPGETKSFCGVYFDCHLGVAVVADTVLPAIGAWQPRTGSYHRLTLRFSNSARRVPMRFGDPTFELFGPDGTAYRRDITAEEEPGKGSRTAPLVQPMEAGRSYTATVVFDAPPGAGPLRLLVRDPDITSRTERILIGDEDSWLHRKTMLAVPAQSATIAATATRTSRP